MTSSNSRVERTQQALLDAMLELIAEKGYDRITVQNVLSRADVGRTTFYEHFDSKQDLLLHRMDRIPWIVRSGDPSHPFDASFLFTHIAEQHRLVAGLQGTKMFDETLTRLRVAVWTNVRDLLHEIDDGNAQGDDIDLTAHALTGAAMQLVVWWIESGMPESPSTMADWFNQFASRIVPRESLSRKR